MMIDVKKVSTLAMVASLFVATTPCAHAMDEDAEFRAAMALSMQDAPLMDQEDELAAARALSMQDAPILENDDEFAVAAALSRQDAERKAEEETQRQIAIAKEESKNLAKKSEEQAFQKILVLSTAVKLEEDLEEDLDAAVALSLTCTEDPVDDSVVAASLQDELDLEERQTREAVAASLAEYNPLSEAQKGRPLEANKDAWGMGDLLHKGLEARPQHMVRDWTNQRAQNTVRMKVRDTSISLEDKQKAADQAKAEAAIKAEKEQQWIQAERVRRLQALENAKVETEKQEKAAAEERAAREQARVQAERARQIRELEAKKHPK